MSGDMGSLRDLSECLDEWGRGVISKGRLDDRQIQVQDHVELLLAHQSIDEIIVLLLRFL